MTKNYRLLPEKFHSQHNFCLGLITEIEKFVTEEDYHELKIQKIDITGKPSINKDEHILDYLLRTGEDELHNKYLKSHIINALLIDILYFLKEAMSASTKQRLTVSFALLRKPFVYDLIILLRLTFTSDFLEEFNSKEKFDSSEISDDDLVELINVSLTVIITKSITKEDIFDFVFNKKNPDSLINISNKALHPSTTRGRSNFTGLQNLNFLFSTIRDIENQWEYFYGRLTVLLIYLVEVCDFTIYNQLGLDENFYTKRLSDRLKTYDNYTNF